MKTCPVCTKEYPDTTKFCPLDGSTLRSKNPTADLIGQVIADRYHIIKKLGEGGMGAVYLGEHVKMGRKSAIKVMAPSMANDPDAISRFNREAANASRISHANVCQIFDFGETPEGIIYLAMEFIEGQSLTDLIEKEGALPPTRAANILKQSADGLAAAHDLTIVHRDLKPDNIMIVQGRDGSDIPKVVDFGIAKAVAGDETGQKVTKTGLVVGTPEYMSPEQLSGDKLDGRSDIYSLGLVLYRMLTGVLPFQADSAQETMIKRLTDDPMPLAEARPDIAFPPNLQAVLDKALARSPAERYANAAEFGRDTMDAVAGTAVPETRVDVQRITQAATQVMDTDTALKLSTKYQQAAKGGKAAPAAAPLPVAGKKKSPVLMYAVAGVVVVGALGGGAVMMMKGANGATGPDSTAQLAANAPTGTPANPAPTSPGTATPAPPTSPGTRPVPQTLPGTTKRESTTAPAPAPTPNAGATLATIEDSLNAAVTADQNGQSAAARRLARWVFYRNEANSKQKADAAELVATTYDTDNDQALTWLRYALPHATGQQRTRIQAAINTLGGNP